MGVQMKAGKLSESVLRRSVLKQLHKVSPAKGDGPGVGKDFARLCPGEGSSVVCAVATMPFWYEGSVGATIHRACNNLYCAFAKPKGIMVSLLLPTSATEQTLRDIMGEIAGVCEAEQLLVLGGHTEVVRSVAQVTLSITAVGEVLGNPTGSCATVQPGMDLIVSKWIGLEGTTILAKTKEEELGTRYSAPFLEKAKKLEPCLSIRSEAAVAAMSGVVAMHDISEGGIYGALWEMAQCAGVGLEIDLKKIPIRQETVEICEFFDIKPYKLLSGGSVLMAAVDGTSVVREIEGAGGMATVIGKATDGNDRVLICEDEHRFLETTQTDELWKVLGQ